jgi:hypothetical protein
MAAEPRESPLDLARAILDGLKDTAHDMVEEGRRGAREANENWWRRFDDKTRFRGGRPKR